MDYELDLGVIDPEGITAAIDVVEDFTPMGLLSDFGAGVINGDAAVAQQKRNETALANTHANPFMQESGLSDLYDGVTELPGVSDSFSSQRSLDRGVTNAGAFIHNSVAGLFD